jgi:hypothetical protein
MELAQKTQLATYHFDTYRGKYPSRAANTSKIYSDDELEDLSRHSEVASLERAPSDRYVVGSPPFASNEHGTNKFLWLVGTDDVPTALEEGPLGRTRKRERLTHTNLSGGSLAHSGGELWFRDQNSVWLTGGSDRYRPRDSQELENIAQAFRLSGYRVASCGWDRETDHPARYFRGSPNWQ